MPDRCSDCRWFDNTVEKPSAKPADGVTGLCRVSAPVRAMGTPGDPAWPFCRATDWCGRFAAREG